MVGFDRWCWPDADPLTLLPGPGLAEHDHGRELPRALEQEYSGLDYATKEHVGRGRTPVLSLRRSTAGDLHRSPRWDDVLGPAGIGDVAMLACRDRYGCWGWLELYRDRNDRPFAGQDLQLLARLSPVLGAAQRLRVSAGPSVRSAQPRGAGVILLDPDLHLLGRTDAARGWVDELPGAALFAGWGILPPAVYAAATRARRGMEDSARCLGRSNTGSWVQIEAARIAETTDVTVTVHAAAARDVCDLVARAHGLTTRERQVVQRLTAGEDTDDIAHALVISPWTVQDHLKSIFDKLGVHSRAEAVARLGA